MAEDRKTGTLAGISLQMEILDDSYESAIARYDYPYADGSDLEDMGQRAHLIRMRAFFWDDAEQATYNDHIALVNTIKTRDLLDFIHPKYGLLKGKIEQINIRHDDRERTAEVDINFVEQMVATIEPSTVPAVLSTVEEAYVDGQAEQMDALLDDLLEEIPLPDAAVVDKILSESQTMLSQVQEFSAACRNIVGTVETYLSTAEAIVDTVTSPVDSLQSTVSYALTLPGRTVGILSRTVEKTARLCDSLRNFPERFTENLDLAMDDLEASFDDLSDSISGDDHNSGTTMKKHLRVACAQRMALEVAQAFEDDQAAFSSTEGPGEREVMTMPQLEAVLAVVRTRLEAAVSDAREMESLKTMARSLLEYVDSVRLEREKMQAIRLDNPMPLHLVCLKYGLPYSDAERLLKVNRKVNNPNFADGEIMVYVR